MKIELGQLGSGGVVYDIKPYDLPPNIFNNTLNVEFDGLSIRPMRADVPVLAPLPEPFIPLNVFQGTVYGDIIIWVAACSDRIFIYYVNSWINVTPTGMYSASSWNIFSYNGYIILHSENNYPYYVDLYDFLSPVKVLPNWPLVSKCKHLGEFSGFMVGLGLTSSDGYFDKQLAFWSDVAELGSLPPNWSFSDPTSRAGFVSIPGDEEFLLGLELGKSYIIYRSKSIYEMRFIGGNSIFAFERRDRNTRLLNKDSVVEIDGNHFFIGNDSFYMYNGISKQTIGKGLVSDTLFSKWNSKSVSVQSDPDNLKIWIYYSYTSDIADTAMCFRYKQGLFFPRESSNTFTTSKGRLALPQELLRWADVREAWSVADLTWEVIYQNTSLNQLILAKSNGFFSTAKDDVFMPAYIERSYLALAEEDQAGAPTVNRTLRKFVREIWPELGEGQIYISFGTSEVKKSDVTWTPYKKFDSDIQLKQDWAFSSKFISIRMSNVNPANNSTSDFSLTGYALEIEPGGKY